MINELSPGVKRCIAAVFTAATVGIILLALYGVYTLFLIVGLMGMVTILSYCLGAIVGIVLLLVFLAMIRSLYLRIYAAFFDKHLLSKKEQGAWVENTGVKPIASRVNAEYADNTITWNVDPDTLDWSTDKSNPIVKYMRK